MELKKVICWWSGGVTSAVACKLAIDIFGIDRCRFIMIDTMNEHNDTYRFKIHCEAWYGKAIEVIKNDKHGSIQDVWRKFASLNVANGAICSSELKREVRIAFERLNEYDFQVFGFDSDEVRRAKAMRLNYPKSKPIFPLLLHALSKKDCIKIISDAGIEVPDMYKMGFSNNNCFGTGCIQGGIGYWQKMRNDFPEKFDAMANMEHELTNKKGIPVTMLKDQGKDGGLVFLKPHPLYPLMKDISMMKGRHPEPLIECNGFCGTYDLEK
jgi:hypothetical protein